MHEGIQIFDYVKLKKLRPYDLGTEMAFLLLDVTGHGSRSHSHSRRPS